MHKSKILVLSLLAFFLAGPALADNSRVPVCTSYISLAATSDDTTLAIAPPGGAKILAVGCAGDDDVATPPQISFEDAAANAVTHATLTCAENGANLTWIPATAANTFLGGEPIVYDIDNLATTGDYTVCVYLETRD